MVQIGKFLSIQKRISYLVGIGCSVRDKGEYKADRNGIMKGKLLWFFYMFQVFFTEKHTQPECFWKMTGSYLHSVIISMLFKDK